MTQQYTVYIHRCTQCSQMHVRMYNSLHTHFRSKCKQKHCDAGTYIRSTHKRTHKVHIHVRTQVLSNMIFQTEVVVHFSVFHTLY